MKRLLILGLLLLPLLAVAATPTYPFDTPEQEKRFQTLSAQLRCLVCQGQAIGDSNADLAVDMRKEVHRMIVEGQSDQEIVDYMVARYGDFVLFKPPVNASTYLLWFGPFVLALIGVWVLFTLVRRHRAPAELSP